MSNPQYRRVSCLVLAIVGCMVGAVSQAVAAECVLFDILADRRSSVIFIGDFESGSVEDWGHARVFSVTEILDLRFFVGFDEALQGDHVLQLVIRTPNGHVYQKLEAPVSSDFKKAGAMKKLQGYPKPVPIRVTGRQELAGKAVYVTSLELPVGGTSIESSSIFGQWSVEVVLDGEVTGSAADTSFFVVQ